mmetsp:Transcript_7919/g.29616  ORF Transcript_7919/g.29616 Transcript_7919/m.29616 type:complete len:432 (+) Transcript_7919:216-1511(+)
MAGALAWRHAGGKRLPQLLVNPKPKMPQHAFLRCVSRCTCVTCEAHGQAQADLGADAEARDVFLVSRSVDSGSERLVVCGDRSRRFTFRPEDLLAEDAPISAEVVAQLVRQKLLSVVVLNGAGRLVIQLEVAFCLDVRVPELQEGEEALRQHQEGLAGAGKLLGNQSRRAKLGGIVEADEVDHLDILAKVLREQLVAAKLRRNRHPASREQLPPQSAAHRKVGFAANADDVHLVLLSALLLVQAQLVGDLPVSLHLPVLESRPDAVLVAVGILHHVHRLPDVLVPRQGAIHDHVSAGPDSSKKHLVGRTGAKAVDVAGKLADAVRVLLLSREVAEDRIVHLDLVGLDDDGVGQERRPRVLASDFSQDRRLPRSHAAAEEEDHRSTRLPAFEDRVVPGLVLRAVRQVVQSKRLWPAADEPLFRSPAVDGNNV